MLPTRVLRRLSQEKLIRRQIGNSGKVLWEPLLHQVGVRKNNRLFCWLAYGSEASWFLTRGEGRGVSRGQGERWLRCFAHPFGGGECRGHVQFPAFAPKFCFSSNTLFCSQLFRSGRVFCFVLFCFVFLYLLVINLP